MPLPNPIYIDAYARHEAPEIRLMAYAAMQGQEGVVGDTHLEVTDLLTPGGAVEVAPGAYSILNTGDGGGFEGYLGKVPTTEQVVVDPTDSSGSRTDLIILRVKNPYVSGTGSSWPEPVDRENGPYVELECIQGVAPNIQSVKAHNDSWTAISLARITRPANTGIVEQAHITDLRPFAVIGGERVWTPTDPGPAPPPFGQALWTGTARPAPGAAFDDLLESETSFTYWPAVADWQVPIPSYARKVDVFVSVANPAQITGHVWGETRLEIDGVANVSNPTRFDMDAISTTKPNRIPVHCTGTQTIGESSRGRVVRVRMQARQFADAATTGTLRSDESTDVYISLNFKSF